MQGLVGPFDPSFGLRSVGADDLDVQFLHRPSELGQPTGSSQGTRLIDPEDAMFVAVEGHRFAVPLEIVPSGFTIGKKGLVRHKPQLQQLPVASSMNTSKVHFGPLFEPGMIRAIDLHQLPKTGPPLPHLVRRRLFGPLRLPQPFLDHELAHTFPAESRMPCTSLSFSCASVGPKSAYLLFQQIQCLLLHARIQPMVARLPAPSAHQSLALLSLR